MHANDHFAKTGKEHRNDSLHHSLTHSSLLLALDRLAQASNSAKPPRTAPFSSQLLLFTFHFLSPHSSLAPSFACLGGCLWMEGWPLACMVHGKKLAGGVEEQVKFVNSIN